MEKEHNLSNVKLPQVTSRLQVCTHIIRMINESVNRQDTSDAIVVAVLHVWCGELIGGDRKQIKVHRQGLDTLIRLRGGLKVLGAHGILAKTVVK